MRLLVLFVTPTLLFTNPSLGQAINFDFGPASSNPTSHYGAASGQVGVWFSSGSSQAVDIFGNPINIRISNFGFGSSASGFAGGLADDHRLMEDFFFANDGSDSLGIGGLQPGRYRLYLYMWNHTFNSDSGPTGFTVFTNFDFRAMTTPYTPDWPGEHVDGITYRTWDFELSPGDGLGITPIINDGERAYIQGLQLVPIPAPAAVAPLLAALCVSRRRR